MLLGAEAVLRNMQHLQVFLWWPHQDVQWSSARRDEGGQFFHVRVIERRWMVVSSREAMVFHAGFRRRPAVTSAAAAYTTNVFQL